ncbi:MAG TPA: polymer-forming cytoskeletal protein [Thermoanaerobaculia bacterium]|nr:polymer-forming cytoskeletal protein [Thermoanaerobaculia bacterium]
MWNPSDFTRRGTAAQRLLRAGLAVFALALSGPALAQERPPSAAPPAPTATPPTPAAPAEAPSDLRPVIEQSYEVLPLHNGVMLRPRKERVGVRTIELSGDTIAVNGERVTEGVLRAWLVADAEPVLRLAHLPPRERQALFGLPTTEGIPAERTAPAGPAGETDIPAEGEIAPGSPDKPETPPAPGAPEPPNFPSSTSGSRLRFGGGITVDKDELAEEAVAIMGSVRVDGEVSRDVTAVGGSVTINGRVGGNVTAVGGNVRLGPNAVVDGDVTSAGGKIVRSEGARVHGKTTEAGVVPSDRDWDHDVDITFHPWSPFLSDAMDLFWQLAAAGILALLVCLCLLVARGPLERVERHVENEPWVAGLVGLVAQLAFIPLLVALTILLVITIVGCALIALYPFLFIALGLAALLGYAAVAHRLGRFLEVRFGRRFGSPYAVALVGVMAIEIWSLLGRVIGLGGGFLDFLAFTVLAFGFVVQYAAWTVGFGAVLLARFGSARGSSYPVAPPPPAPPPAPVPYDPALDGTGSPAEP